MQFALEITKHGNDILQHEIKSPAWTEQRLGVFKKYFSNPIENKDEFLYVFSSMDRTVIDTIEALMYSLTAWKLEPMMYRFIRVVSLNDVRICGCLSSSFGTFVQQCIKYDITVEHEAMFMYMKQLDDALTNKTFQLPCCDENFPLPDGLSNPKEKALLFSLKEAVEKVIGSMESSEGVYEQDTIDYALDLNKKYGFDIPLPSFMGKDDPDEPEANITLPED